MNQWRNTKSVMELFKAITNKGKSLFIKLDIVEFYTSLSKELSSKVVKFAQSVTIIGKKL